jgi:hypothetical protein
LKSEQAKEKGGLEGLDLKSEQTRGEGVERAWSLKSGLFHRGRGLEPEE